MTAQSAPHAKLGRRQMAVLLRRPQRRSFTLIELLIAISIVAILAVSILFVMTGAIERANEARARSQVTRISELLMRRWEEYRSRPVPIRIPANQGGARAAWTRLNALWELKRMEMPDRKSDVFDNQVFLRSRPSLSRAYFRRAQQATGPMLAGWSETHESAECLYLILANMRDGDGVATDLFSASEVGDTDGDGMREFLDPWGNPIYFLRWAPRLRTPIQSGDPAVAPDPFDPFRAGAPPGAPPNFALFPFVYSAGPDGQYGYDQDLDLQYSQTTAAPPGAVYVAPPGVPTWSNNPYWPMSTAGAPLPGVSNDDIHNHITQ